MTAPRSATTRNTGPEDVFERDRGNPILVPGTEWWEARGVFNPGVTLIDQRVAMLYRATGLDGFDRFGLAWSDDGRRFDERRFFCEPASDDPTARIGLQDPRLTMLEGQVWASYTKAWVEPVGSPLLDWEPAPYGMQSALARLDLGNSCLLDERPLLKGVRAKDGVIFPRRLAGRFHVLIRVYPSIQLTSSTDLRHWDAPRTILEPVPGTWEGERIGAGPPPIETPWGWLLVYHGNAHYRPRGNRRHYSTGFAVLDRDDPARVLYRHPAPILSPRAAYELEGPVGEVVFATGLIQREDRFFLYYGAADGAVGLATAPVEKVYALLEHALGRPPEATRST